jgi:hypothetical protein
MACLLSMILSPASQTSMGHSFVSPCSTHEKHAQQIKSLPSIVHSGFISTKCGNAPRCIVERKPSEMQSSIPFMFQFLKYITIFYLWMHKYECNHMEKDREALFLFSMIFSKGVFFVKLKISNFKKLKL